MTKQRTTYQHRGAPPPGQPIDVPGVDQSVKSKRQRDTSNLRALLANTVLEYTTLKRRHQISQGVHPEDAVEIVEDYDPVVAMALLASTTNNADLAMTGHANVAKFVRPTLKSVEVISDRDKEADIATRNAKAAELLSAIDDMARERRQAHDARVRMQGVVLDQKEETLT